MPQYRIDFDWRVPGHNKSLAIDDNRLNDGLLANACGGDDHPLVGAPNGGHETERMEDKSADLYGSQFPYKLHRLLDDAKGMGFEDVITWTSDGRAFQIFDKDKLETLILPHYFSSGRFKTFQRSLNLWSFRVEPLRVERQKVESRNPPATVSCRRRYHPLFRQGCPELCLSMTRTEVKIPGARRSKQSHAAMANVKGLQSCQEQKLIKQTLATRPTISDSPKPCSSTSACRSLLPHLSLPVAKSMEKESGSAPLEGVMAMIRNQQSRAISNRLAFASTTNDTSIIMPVKATMPFFLADSVPTSFPPEYSLLGHRLSYIRPSLLHQQVAAQKHQRLVTAVRAHHHEMAIMSILQSIRGDFSAGSIS